MSSAVFPRLASVALFLLGCAICLAAEGPRTEAVRDSFDYTAWDSGAKPMNRVWYLHSGHQPSSSPEGGIILGNGAVSRPLESPAIADFEVTFSALHRSYKRGVWVGLLADSGRGGYGVLWDASVPGQFSGQGHVSIRKLELPPETPPAFNQMGVLLSDSVVPSGHNASLPTDAAIREPFARFRLTWKKSGGMLSLYVNDALCGTTYDTTFTRFDRLLIQGSHTSRVRDLRVLVSSGATPPLAQP